MEELKDDPELKVGAAAAAAAAAFGDQPAAPHVWLLPLPRRQLLPLLPPSRLRAGGAASAGRCPHPTSISPLYL